MTIFPSITGSRLIRALRKLGFEEIRIKGSHHFLRHQDGRCTVIPVHRGESIGRLQDIHARARILVRIERLRSGNPGDVEPVGEGISELRIDYGPGYRVYCKKMGQKVVILLAGGDKRTQNKDIKTAISLSRNL